MRSLGFVLIAFLSALNFPSEENPATANRLPPGIFRTLAPEVKEFCEDQFTEGLRKDCEKKFASHLRWRDLNITPSGQSATLVENSNIGFCGQGGCALYLFVARKDASFVQILGSRGGLGTLERVAVSTNATRGYYDLSVTWSDGKTRSVYRWDGSQYSD